MADKPEENETGINQSKAAGEEAEVRKYDFLSPRRLSSEQERILGRVNEIVAQRMAHRLEEICRCKADVGVGSSREMSVSELKEPCWADKAIAMFTTTGTESKGLISMDSNLTLSVVERILGGTNQPLSADRSLTTLERQVALEGFEMLLQEYAEGWTRLARFSPAIIGTWCQILPEEVLTGADWAVAVEFSVKVGGLEGKLTVHLLLPGCEPLISKLTTHRWAADKAQAKAEDRAKVIEVIQEVELPLSAVLNSVKFSLADLLEMSVGDIMCLDAEKSSDLEIWTGGRATLLAKPVMIDGHIGMRVSKEL
ncbi:MAG: hypothetical protein GTO55_08740, partial [Armatimonadetes bacterium]|nr:hypothetical protein [Armatimonadota bacterium]NIM24333.1 hypothetical protein [Armatimonadota bacterium]NIM68202.1 hypothetical protein [Armatimonadota bacterium]NIM75103.1 hypothetical protein [Armatimonadota bacterium]NIN06407.1 hypothetical protein [Armatimonadota bacterium]